MKTKEEIEAMIVQAEQMQSLDRKEIAQLMEDEESNADEILTVQASLDRLTGSIQAYKYVLG